jgi:uncharacterized membrane protein
MADSNSKTQILRAAGAAAVGCVAGLGVVSALLPTASVAVDPGLLAPAWPVGAVAGALVGLATYGSYRVFRMLDEAL